MKPNSRCPLQQLDAQVSRDANDDAVLACGLAARDNTT
jgi:hypothetical protein